MTGRLEGRTAIVTGGGQGIGAAISTRFAEEGARVVIAQRTEHIAEGHAKAIRDAGGEAIAVPTDVSRRDDIERLVERTVEIYGPPTTLVNNAGIAVFGDPLTLTPEQWQRCFSVDLDSAWWASQAVLPHLLAAGAGSIINIASVHSFGIIPGCFPYPVAKHGLIGLTRALAAEYGAPRRARQRHLPGLHRDEQRARVLRHLPRPGGRAGARRRSPRRRAHRLGR